MKANELMVDDWVRITEPDPHHGFDAQVQSIGGINNYLTVFIPFQHGKDVFVEDVEPIPITDGFLLKNGFIEKGHGVDPDDEGEPIEFRYWDYEKVIKESEKYPEGAKIELTYTQMYNIKEDGVEDDWWSLRGYSYNAEVELYGAAIYNIHELQHILRFIGIEEEVVL